MMNLTRRQAMALGGSALIATAVGIKPVFAANDSKELIEKFTGGKSATEGKISLDLPEIAENGNTVPLSLKVDSPMSKDNFVKRVIVVADGNPRGAVATFHFSPAAGQAEASTRMRLAKTQNVIAVAEMSDGSFYTASKQVKVTVGGCGG